MTTPPEPTAQAATPAPAAPAWPKHVVRAGPHERRSQDPPEPNSDGEFSSQRQHIEPWLSALMQAEHVSLLLGSGFTTGVARAGGAKALDMSTATFAAPYANAVERAASTGAARMQRGPANIEDQIRAVSELLGGLRVLREAPPSPPNDVDGLAFEKRVRDLASAWEGALDGALARFLSSVLATEQGIYEALVAHADTKETRDRANELRRLLAGFLLAFASRSPSRERLHIFTTNYDRLIEFGSDLLGLRLVDRFVGTIAPTFRSSRLGVDLHYNPPGIRGEPRYLEGVVRLTKLHGSVDWQWQPGPSGQPEVQRIALPFGAAPTHSAVPKRPGKSLMVYPNSAKDKETLEYPYAELFRDFAGAVCQPNAVLVTYGYGFGDDHVNRVIGDMLTIPSTHVAIISYDDAGGRLPTFCDRIGRPEQITLLVGSHFGDLTTLVANYLPKPAIDKNTYRMAEILGKRPEHLQPARPTPEPQQESKEEG